MSTCGRWLAVAFTGVASGGHAAELAPDIAFRPGMGIREYFWRLVS